MYFYWYSDGLFYKGGDYGFIFFYVINFVVLIMFVGLFMKKNFFNLIYWFVFSILLVCYLCIYFGVYYFMDVVGGIFWGMFFGIVVWIVVGRKLLI